MSTWLRSFSSSPVTLVPLTQMSTVSTAAPMLRYAPAVLVDQFVGSVNDVV